LGPHGLPSGHLGQHPALRSRTCRLCPDRRRFSAQADRARPGPGWLAQHATPAGPRPCPLALPATVLPGIAARRTSLAADQFGARHPPFRLDRRPRGRPSRLLCGAASPSRPRALHHPLPLVAAALQKTTSTEVKLVSLAASSTRWPPLRSGRL